MGRILFLSMPLIMHKYLNIINGPISFNAGAVGPQAYTISKTGFVQEGSFIGVREHLGNGKKF